jgi:hypothetical protein
MTVPMGKHPRSSDHHAAIGEKSAEKGNPVIHKMKELDLQYADLKKDMDQKVCFFKKSTFIPQMFTTRSWPLSASTP